MVEITIRKRPQTEAVITQRKFFKKTARGKVIKVLRERYLRDDVSCGIAGCRECPDTPEESLPSNGDQRHRLFPNGHFILPDTNVFLAQMDLIESSLFNPPMILLQTVLEEVRHRSLPLYNRLKALTKSEDKRIWVFYNEYRSETAIIREENETPNDRNDRGTVLHLHLTYDSHELPGIRKATEWYNTHISLTRPPIRGQPQPILPAVVLLTEDAANRQKAEQAGIHTMSVRKYVEGLPDSNQLLDLLSAAGSDDIDPTKAAAGRQVLYPEYLPSATLVAGVKAGELHQGHFNANQYNYLEVCTKVVSDSHSSDTIKGTVPVPAFDKPILLRGRENMNRAVQGDIVVVEVFDEKEWKAPGDEVVDQEATLKNDDAEDSGEEGDENGEDVIAKESRVLQHEATSQRNPVDLQPTGRVVGIIKRNWRAYTVFATPVSRLLPRIRLRTRQAPSLIGQKILVTIDRWDTTSRYPEGHFVRALGKVESKEAEQENCLPEEGEQWVVPPKESDPKNVWRDREDLRDVIVCSIDPPGCQDIDDALHAKQLPNGNIEAGVREFKALYFVTIILNLLSDIADVSHFVHPDNPMDSEAAARGTTVYLVDKRIDMLPSLLGTNLCSLRPFVERLAFSVIWELTPDAEIVNVRFTKSVIKSNAAFTYEEAQIRKDDPNLQDDLTHSIRLLNSLAIKLKGKRMAAGALNLASPEVKIHLDSAESSDPIDVEQKELRETNSLVEEFMLLANVSVARKIEEGWPGTAVLRCVSCVSGDIYHLPKTNFEKLQDILKKTKGMDLDVSSSGALAASLDKCVDPSEPSFNTLVRIMATRCMLSAEYFCSGSVARDTFRHYGLASEIYTHFTSPIRRYAGTYKRMSICCNFTPTCHVDVLVHRQLSACIGHTPLHPSLHSKSNVERIMDVINRRHRMAQMAGRASVEFYVGLALKGRIEREGSLSTGGVSEEAYVIRTFRNDVQLMRAELRLGIEGLVTFRQNLHTFDADNYTITVGQKHIKIFDKVSVKIEVEKDKNTQRGKVKMTLVEPIDSSVL
ncbi:exosome catalytic subunit dis3 [Paramarasmius palmivorus]|uniref:Ribosomal RNA-processing protein 44 n=1 Tax=Paramarasmius palmivorus TaxID=297713 RepID=A0AAW0EA91_9AGAR